MRRLALLGFGSAAGMPGPRAFAQEATPAPQPTLEGVAYLPLGYLLAVTMPDALDMEVGRGTLQPGAGFAFTADDPAAGVMIMSAGEMTAVVEDAPWTISRGAAEVVQVVAAGEVATFSVGVVAYIPGHATGELRNSGDEPAVALLISVVPTGA